MSADVFASLLGETDDVHVTGSACSTCWSELGVYCVEDDLLAEWTLSTPSLAPPENEPLGKISGNDDLSDVNDGSLNLNETFSLQSNPEANHFIYLDFDGHVTTGTDWNRAYSSNEPIHHDPWSLDEDRSTFSNSELATIQRIWASVAEDYAPFNVNVTTQDPGLDALTYSGPGDARWGVRVVISPDTWFPGEAGGTAYTGSFRSHTDTPVFVFNKAESGTREAITHEVGHTLGLSHDGRGSDRYHSGDSGTLRWGPIMGAAYFADVTQWSRGEYQGANQLEDDLQIIATQNGFGYRADKVGNDRFSAQPFVVSNNVISAQGIIEQSTDVDFFSFVTGSGRVKLTVDTARYGANLDVLARLYDASGNLVAESNPTNQLSAALDVELSAGTYYLSIDGVGQGDPLGSNAGYTDYGSLGHYWINGTIVKPAPPSPAPVPKPELVSYFDQNAGGVWRYTDAEGWIQITGADASQIATSSNGVLYADFDLGGLWRYTMQQGWQQLTNGNATVMAADGQGNLYANVDFYGVFRFEPGSGWRQLTGANARLLISSVDGVVYADFLPGGVFRYTQTEGWQQLTGANAAQMVTSEGGVMYADFDLGGLWRYTREEGWRQLTNGNATMMALTATGALYANVDVWGVFQFRAGEGWTRLTGANARRMVGRQDGSVFVEFETGGLWYFSYEQRWRQLTGAQSVGMSVGAAGDLFADFAWGGIWRHLDDEGWRRLS